MRNALVIFFLCLSITVGCNGNNKNSNDTTNNISPNDSSPAPCENLIPPEQPAGVRHAKNPYPSPPTGYHAVIGWVNATIGEGGTSGSVTVKNLKLWEKTNNNSKIIAERIICPGCDSENHVWGYSLLKSEWSNPTAWSKSNEGSKFQVSDKSIIIPVDERPDDVYHFWHALWPRPSAISGATYYLTADVEIEGDAIIQIGIDFWQETGGGGAIEAAVSDWHCAKESSVQTIVAGTP